MTRPNIPAKANKVLNYVLLALFLILIRVWYLGLFQHDKYLELAKKPRRKTVLKAPIRGTIHDRFQVPLAVNRINYFASILYEDIREIPKVRFEKNGKEKKKVYLRKEHITKLSQKLAEELEMDTQDIEDLIYSRAAIFPSTAITIKDNLSEKQYYRLKSLQRMYKGLYADKKAKRYYPQNEIAADIIGYIGQIDEREYFSRQEKIQKLSTYLKNIDEGLAVFLPDGFSSAEEVKLALEREKAQPLLLTETVGKAGLELQFDKELKGQYGKSLYEVNTKGKYIRNLPGSKPAISGKRLNLNISSELQAYAEKLLGDHEMLRDKNFRFLGDDNGKVPVPWIKGGSVVAMIPKTGEVVCMASYPRMNNNDFSQIDLKNRKSLSAASKWLESNYYISRIWDGKEVLEREFYSLKDEKYIKETKDLSLDVYLDMILSPKSSVKKQIKSLSQLNNCSKLLEASSSLLDLSEQPNMYSLIDAMYPNHKQSVFGSNVSHIKLIQESLAQHPEHVQSLKSVLDPHLKQIQINDDKLLFLDLLRLLSFSEPLERSEIHNISLETHHNLRQALSIVQEELLVFSKDIFHKHNFKLWRQDCFKDYLKIKRKEEKEKHTYQRPYLDYLIKAEKDLFSVFWNNFKWDLISAFIFDTNPEIYELSHHLLHLTTFKETVLNAQKEHKTLRQALKTLKTHLASYDLEECFSYLKTLKSFKELKEPLYGYYSQIKKPRAKQTLQDLAKAFYPFGGFGFGRSYSYRQSTPLGSIFKVVTAYEALKQYYKKNSNESEDFDLNPLTIRDEMHPKMKTPQGIVLGFTEDGKKITRRYKGGTLPRSHASLGRIDFFGAMERSSNIYFSLLASDVIETPSDLVTASADFGLGTKTGIDLPGEIPGYLPKDLEKNRSGLYSFAIGQHSLIATPIQTAIMLSSLCNNGEILKPQIIKKSTGKESYEEKFLCHDEDYPYKKHLNSIGIYFPFFLDSIDEKKHNAIKTYSKEVCSAIYLPTKIKDYLLDSMHSVVSSVRGNSRPEIIRYLRGKPTMYRNYVKLRNQFAGKTSTAEIMYNPTLDRECVPIITKDVWFGALAFKQPKILHTDTIVEEDPELVVVVYLRFGNYGKEAAPIAAEIVTKYRELCKKYQDKKV